MIRERCETREKYAGDFFEEMNSFSSYIFPVLEFLNFL